MAACKYTTSYLETNFYPNFGCYAAGNDERFYNPFYSTGGPSDDPATGCRATMSSNHPYLRYSGTPNAPQALNIKVTPGSTGEASCAQCDNLYKLSANRTACIRMSGAASGSWQPETCQTGYRLNLVSDNYKDMTLITAVPDKAGITGSTDDIWGPSVNLRWNNQYLAATGFSFSDAGWNMVTYTANDKINDKLSTNKQWRMVTNYLLSINESMPISDVEYVYDRNCVWVSGCSKLNDSSYSSSTTADALTFDANQFCVDCQNNFRLSIEEPKLWLRQRGWLPMPHSLRLQKTLAFRSGCIEVEGCFRNAPSSISDGSSQIMNLGTSSCTSGCTKTAMANTDDHKKLPSPLHCMYCNGSNKRLTLSVGRRDSAKWYGLDFSTNQAITLSGTYSANDTFTPTPAGFDNATVDSRALKMLWFKPLNFKYEIYYHYFPHPSGVSPDQNGTYWGGHNKNWGQLTNPDLFKTGNQGQFYEASQNLDRNLLPDQNLNEIYDANGTQLSGGYNNTVMVGNANQFRITCEERAV